MVVKTTSTKLSGARPYAMRVLFVNHTGLVSGAEHSLMALIDDGTTGLLARPGEPTAWSSAIRRIVEHWGLRIRSSTALR